MDLGLTWRADYTLRAAVELARRYHDGQWHKADPLAKATGIPPGYIRQILRMLVQGGMAEARAGNAGGYRLQRDPGEITVLELVETGEGPLLSTRCVMRGIGCNRRKPCLFHSVITRGQDALRTELQATTLRSVMADAPVVPGRSR